MSNILLGMSNILLGMSSKHTRHYETHHPVVSSDIRRCHPFFLSKSITEIRESTLNYLRIRGPPPPMIQYPRGFRWYQQIYKI